MSEYLRKTGAHWQDATNFLLGVGFFLSPWFLGLAAMKTVAWNAWIIGVVIALVAGGALLAYQKWEEWVNVALGIWLVISPWVLKFSATREAMFNAVIVGLLVLGLAFWAATTEHEPGPMKA